MAARRCEWAAPAQSTDKFCISNSTAATLISSLFICSESNFEKYTKRTFWLKLFMNLLIYRKLLKRKDAGLKWNDSWLL